MRRIVLSIGLLLIVVLASAQNPLSKGSAQLNAGLGFSNHGIPIYLGFDFGVHPDVSIGGEICFRSYHENHPNGTYNNTGIGLLFNGNYHFNTLMNIPSNWDFYAGLNVGFTFWNWDDDYVDEHDSGFGLGAQIGGRYFFTDKFGINLELGGGNASSGGKFGITYKF